MSRMDAGATPMTEPTDPDQSIAVVIRALRHGSLSAGRHIHWEGIRERIRHLLIERRPSPDERLELLELYDQVVTRVERLRAGDIASLRRLRHQRAADTLRFVFVEARHEGALSFGAIVDRELVAGRLRVDPYLSEVLGELLRVFDAGGGGSPGVNEDCAAFLVPRVQPPTRQPAFSAMAVKNSGS
jgi:hypothetical protein